MGKSVGVWASVVVVVCVRWGRDGRRRRHRSSSFSLAPPRPLPLPSSHLRCMRNLWRRLCRGPAKHAARSPGGAVVHGRFLFLVSFCHAPRVAERAAWDANKKTTTQLLSPITQVGYTKRPRQHNMCHLPPHHDLVIFFSVFFSFSRPDHPANDRPAKRARRRRRQHARPRQQLARAPATQGMAAWSRPDGRRRVHAHRARRRRGRQRARQRQGGGLVVRWLRCVLWAGRISSSSSCARWSWQRRCHGLTPAVSAAAAAAGAPPPVQPSPPRLLPFHRPTSATSFFLRRHGGRMRPGTIVCRRGPDGPCRRRRRRRRRGRPGGRPAAAASRRLHAAARPARPCRQGGA